MPVDRERIAVVVGPGPVTLQEGAGIQYLAARGCRCLREKGFRIVVLEDNPATLMDAETDGEGIFMEPPLPEVLARVVEKTRAETVWLGLAGRRGWELFMTLAAEGGFESLGVHVPDVDDRTLWLCGDRGMLREMLENRGLANPVFRAVSSMHEGQKAADEMSFPLVARPHFSCGGWGAGIAYNGEEFPVLLEEALRESPTREALLEECLSGYRKFVLAVLRDAGGDCEVAGICEQLEPLPLHEEDAMLVTPPRGGAEEMYALREEAREVVEALGLVGLAEIKMAASAGWEELYVLDVNPRPWRVTPLLEVAGGVDLLRMHVELLCGGELGACRRRLSKVPRETVLSLPHFFYGKAGEEQGCRRLRCRAVGRTLLRGKTVEEAAAAALGFLEKSIYSHGREGGASPKEAEHLAAVWRWARAERRRPQGGECAGAQRKRGEAEAQSGGVSLPAAGVVGHGIPGDGGPHRPSKRGYPFCLARRPGESPAAEATGIMILGGDNGLPGAGHEYNFAAYRALLAAKKKGMRTALYATDASFALLTVESADAVYLGPLLPEGVVEAMGEAEAGALCCQFGGKESLACGEAILRQSPGTCFLETEDGARGGIVNLEEWARRGIRTAPFTARREDAPAFLRRCKFPVLAEAELPGGAHRRRILFTPEEGHDFLSGLGEDSVLLREIHEEAQEVLVEAVAAGGDAHALVLWEILEEMGTDPSDGLAVYPPAHLTSAQARAAEELARRVISRLSWKGNLSLRMMIGDGEALLWDLCLGASAALPYLTRASGMPLAEMGLQALFGEKEAAYPAQKGTSAWRYPVVPLGIIAGEDILPTARRRSTGSRVGMATHPSVALAKIHRAQGLVPRPGGKAFLSVANREKRRAVLLARELSEAGYLLAATRGTAQTLRAAGLQVTVVNKLREGRPNVLDLMRNGEIHLVVNIPRGRQPKSDGFYIREEAARQGLPCLTDMEVALALVRGLRVSEPSYWEAGACGMCADNVCRAKGAGGK